MAVGRILPKFCTNVRSLDTTWLRGFFLVGCVRLAGLGDSDVGWSESSGKAESLDISQPSLFWHVFPVC